MLEKAEIYTLLGSYYSFRDDLTSILMLNNKGAMALQVTPTFYSLDGTALQIPPLTVNASSYTEINLSDLLANAPQKFHEGNLQVSYEGGDYQLGSQVKIIDAPHSLIWEEQHFEAESKYISSKLEGVWWLPSKNCKTKFILTNTTDETVTATVDVDGTKPKQDQPALFELKPHQPRVLNVMDDLVGANKGDLEETGGVSISHTGEAGAVMARMLISKPNKGFSSTMYCIDPQMTGSSRWHGAGLRIGKIGNKNTQQILAVRNTGDIASHIKGKFYYTKENGNTASINIPRVKIVPRSSKTIDLQKLLDTANLSSGIKYGGLEMEYDTAPGSVVISSLSHSKDENLVFQVPVYDPAKTASSAGGYPWKTDGDYTTLTYAKNDTGESQKFVLSLMYDGGGYSLGVNEIKPHQTLMVDFKALRDLQIPDPTGRVIPLNINRGQIGWTIKGNANHTVNGRSEQFSLAEGLTSTYDCRNCCPDSFYAGYISPFSATEYIGTGRYFSAFEESINCYGEIFPGNYISPFWQSSDMNIATIDSYGFAEAVGVGATMIQADWSADGWGQPRGSDECQYNIVPVFVEVPEEVIAPTVASITASMPSTKNLVTNQAPAPGTFMTTNISTGFATETTTDLMVVFQNPSQGITITADGINPPASASALKWHIDRDPTDTVASGTPTLSSQSGAQILLTPTTAGNFRLICYTDNNNSGSYEPGEELRVLLFSTIKVSVNSNQSDIGRDLGFQYNSNEPGEFGVLILRVFLNCSAVVEGGGANKRVGLNKLRFGNIGNLTADTAKVNYSGSGTGVELPGGGLPMVDTGRIAKGDEPTGGETAFRNESRDDVTNISSGGQKRDITSNDRPGFGPYLITNPSTGNVWATTEGGYDFREFIAGFSDTFPRTYVVIAKADWAVRFIGSKNSSGESVNGGSTLTLQGGSQTPAPLTITVNNGSPQTGDGEGMQTLGLSYVNEKSNDYN